LTHLIDILREARQSRPNADPLEEVFVTGAVLFGAWLYRRIEDRRENEKTLCRWGDDGGTAA
jgi:hypothetical protein